MSDADLRALEAKGTLPTDEWRAVMDELRRREARSSTPGGAAAPRASAPPTAGGAQVLAGNVPEDARVVEALRQVQAILVPGETLQAFAIQRRLFALTHRRMIVAATSGRFIIVSRGLIGGYTPIDIRWQDIEDARLQVGIFAADISVSSRNREDLASAGHIAGRLTISGLRKQQAQEVYRVSQAQEQAWREKRRIRDLDELRAKSGGVQFGSAGGFAAPGDDSVDPMVRLQRAKEMLANGLITDAEYESIKARIVDRL
jgi:hypothetical protein